MEEKYQRTIDGLLLFVNKLYLTNVVELRKLIMDEFHTTSYESHTVYQNIKTTKKFYLWSGRKEISEYIVKYL